MQGVPCALLKPTTGALRLLLAEPSVRCRPRSQGATGVAFVLAGLPSRKRTQRRGSGGGSQRGPTGQWTALLEAEVLGFLLPAPPRWPLCPCHPRGAGGDGTFLDVLVSCSGL